MPSPAPEPLVSRPLSIWLANPLEDIPGETDRPLRTWILARILAARGHDVVWWSSTWNPRRRQARRLPAGLREDEGFDVRLVATRPIDRPWSFAGAAGLSDFGRTLDRVASETVASGQLQRPDMILATLPPIDGAETCAGLARRLDATFVVDVVERWPESHRCRLPGPAPLRTLLGWLGLGAARRRRDAVVASADACAASDETTLEALQRVGDGTATFPVEAAALLATPSPRQLPGHVCHLGAYLQEFGVAAPQIDEVPRSGTEPAPPPPPRALQCVVTGAFVGCHEGDTILRAARLLAARGTAVVIHVVGAEGDEARLRRVATRVQGSCRLVVHGPLSRRECLQLWAGCEVAVVGAGPDAAVAVPLEACEGAAAGLAVVHPLPGELEQLVDHYEAGLKYDAGVAESLADALATVAADRRELAALRAGARRLAAERFDAERIYAAFADWLETVSATTQPAG